MCDLLGPQTLHRSVGSGERELVITSNLAPDVSAKAAESARALGCGLLSVRNAFKSRADIPQP